MKSKNYLKNSAACSILLEVIRLYGQVVKTPPSHGGYKGSNPLGVTKNDKHEIACRFYLFTVPSNLVRRFWKMLVVFIRSVFDLLLRAFRLPVSVRRYAVYLFEFAPEIAFVFITGKFDDFRDVHIRFAQKLCAKLNF